MIAACLGLCISVCAHAAPETWRFDAAHSQIWFSADHEHFSHPLGRLHIKDGWFQFDSGWYYDIVTRGYSYVPGQQSSVAFFPSFPLLTRVVAAVLPGQRSGYIGG